jgi:antirestriction protein ArdC
MNEIYEAVTKRVLGQLAAGVVPWHKTWETGLPKSLITGKEYRGINILVLGMAPFKSRYWTTFREVTRLGGHVRKSEKATRVIYWKWRTPEEIRKLEERTGKANLAPCVPFICAVFNLDQTEGVDRPTDDVPHQPNRRLEIADQMITVMTDKPDIVHSVTKEPGYNYRLDRITLPHLSQFKNAEEYYGALFHEAVHATGHAKRLDRFLQSEGDLLERYSFEELIAEFGAAFLCGFAGITNPTSEALQAGYIESWSTVFRGDSRVIIRAASAAQRAVDYIRGKLVPTHPVLGTP